MYSSQIRTAIRFSPFIPEDPGDFLDIHVLSDQIVPFQIDRAARINDITTFQIVRTTGEFFDMSTYLDTGDEPYIVNFDGYDKIIYKAAQLTSPMFGGRYYILVSDGVDTWYSMSYINIKCYDTIPPAPIPIGTGYEDIIEDDNNIIIY